MQTKLIIVEGIPGSGKTTTAQYLRDWAESQNLKPRLYLEDAAKHPVDLDNLAYFDQEQYQHLTARFEAHLPVLDQITEKGADGYFVHYRFWGEISGQRLPDDLAAVIYSHDAHDTLPPEKYHQLMVERWQRFGVQAAAQDGLVIFECCFLQNPFTIFTGKHNYEVERVNPFIRELVECVDVLQPVLVFLRSESVRATFERVIATRPRTWIELVEAYITGQGYGKARQLSGVDGVIQFYEMLQKTEEEIVSSLDWRTLTLDVTSWEGSRHYQTITDFLDHRG